MTGIRIKFLMTLAICLTFSVLIIGMQWDYSEKNRKKLNKILNQNPIDLQTYENLSDFESELSIKTNYFQLFEPEKNNLTNNELITIHNETNTRWLLVISLILTAFMSATIVFIENLNTRIRKTMNQIAAFSEGDFNHRQKLEGHDELTAIHVLTNNFGKNLQGYIDSIVEDNRSKQAQKMIVQHIETKRLNERRFLNGYVLNPLIAQNDLLVWGMKWIDENNYIIWSMTPKNMSGSACEGIIELSQSIEDKMDEIFEGNNRFISSTINEVIRTTFDKHEEIVEESLCSLSFIHIDFAREYFEIINHLTPIFIEDDDKDFSLVQTNNTRQSLAAADVSKSKIPLEKINRMIFSSYTLVNSKNPVLCNLSTYRHLKKTTGLDIKKTPASISMIEIKRQIDDIEIEVDGVA